MAPSPSDYATAIPFKKRWQIIRPPSPIPEEPCPILEPVLPLPEESSPILEPNQKKQDSSNASQGSTIVNISAENDKPEISAMAADVSLGMQLYEDTFVRRDKFEHHSVQLGLANEESSSEYSSGVMRSESVVTDLCTNRSNWDLNTTMDAWEGSAGDALSISTNHLHGQLTLCNYQLDKKHLGSTSKMSGVNISLEQIANEHHFKEVNAATSDPYINPPTPRDTLKLGNAATFDPSINPPTPRDTLKLGLGIQLSSSLSQEPPQLFPGIDPCAVFSRVSSVGNSSIVPPLAVKSEPHVDVQACLGNISGDLRSLVGKTVKREIVDKCGLEVSSRALKLFDSRFVKVEPTCEAIPVKLRMDEEASNRLEQTSQGTPLESSRKIQEALPINCPVVNEYQKISSHLKDGSSGREDKEYEDGEVKDRLVADGSVNDTPLGNASKDKDDTEKMESTMNLSYQYDDSPCQEKEDSDMQLCSDMEETHLDEKSQMSVDLDEHLEELSDVEVDYDSTEPATSSAPGAIFPATDENPVIHSDIAMSSGEATINNHKLTGASAQDDAMNSDVQRNISIMPMTESTRNNDATGRDSYTRDNGSRIINLSATYGMSSPGKTGYSSDWSLPLHDGRKRLPNVTLEGDKLQLRGRDEVSSYDLHRLSRERNHVMFSQNSRSGFLCDRGRIPNNVCDGWESDQDFGSEIHKGQLEFRATRYRYNSGYRNYNASPDDGFVGTGRGGRRFLTDNLRNFRRAHEVREGHATQSPPTVDRVLHNMNPCRRTDMDYSELVGVRYGLAQRERNIGSFSGKGLHHINSKSPVRLRSRSPVQWSSPRRRSPGGFVRHPEMAPRRPPIYRRERMGSPDPAYFCSEVVRKHNSPPYTSRRLDELREMNTGRDTSFTRPLMHNRDLSTRVSIRTRRYDMTNSRERTNGDQYYRFPMRGAAQFRDLSEVENTDERRQLNEKRVSIRQLRPSCGSDNKGFAYSSISGSRSYRFCAQDDSVYHEGGNSREVQLESCPTNELGDGHKTRKIDQEGSFSHGVSDEFDDMPRYKREHF
ncbi:hypothetical protein SAY86_023728 [Trapa natans]|uniref:Uncharacterized protein n=1 Tax=Trapa natans TaxID=22666 RepID=A0AAN7RBR9_TRANT|nr:hypothetical protein SAY86_023728 [Trapa natans]